MDSDFPNHVLFTVKKPNSQVLSLPPSRLPLLLTPPPHPPTDCSLSSGIFQVGVGSGALFGVSLQQQDQPRGLRRL